MRHVEAANRVLADAEAKLREVMQLATRGQCYTEVSIVAAMAGACAKAREAGGLERGEVVREAANPSSGEQERGASRGAAARAASGAGPLETGEQRTGAGGPITGTRRERYPQFVRDGDRLVKIGWSKKDKRVYEHRAPRAAVMAVVDAAAGKLKPGRKFELGVLGVVSDPEGSTVPSYQVGLTLRWLRELGMIKKRGRSDYMLSRGIVRGDVEGAWEGLSTR